MIQRKPLARIAAWFTVLLIGAACFSSKAIGLWWIAVSLQILLCLYILDVRPLRLFAAFTLPFLIPLLALHGIVNPAFPETGRFFGWIPVRSTGVEFALLVGARVAAISVVGVTWSFVPRMEALSLLLSLKVPSPLALAGFQAISMIDFLRRRAASILLAQRSRGVATGPSITRRAGALVAVVVPLAASTLTEAEGRAIALTSRGFGSGRLVLRASIKSPLGDEWCVLGISLAAVVLPGLLRW
jgi:energy-coupling factor transporter transmembrane protein EcfT